MKKFRCTVCGYIHEGDAAPEKCPLCKVPANKFVEMEEAAADAPLQFVTEHEIGVAKVCDEEMIKDLNKRFREINPNFIVINGKANRKFYEESCYGAKERSVAH